MKNIFVLLFSILVLGVSAQVDSFPQSPSLDTVTNASSSNYSEVDLFNSANEAFISGQYPLSAAQYEAILEKGLHSASLYYNLGNAYFQQNQIGKAILNYTRAFNIDPMDEDIVYNLELAKSKTKDKIESVPEFFMVRWLGSIGDLLNSNWWAGLAVIFFGVSACGVLFWLISNKISIRKVSFFSALIGIILVVFSIGFSIRASQGEYSSNVAVVINTAAPIKSSPSSGGKDIFILHEGTVVEVLQELDSYSEIKLSDGNKGWIQSSAIETV